MCIRGRKNTRRRKKKRRLVLAELLAFVYLHHLNTHSKANRKTKRNRPECSKAARRRPKRTHQTEQNGKAARRARYSETDVLHLNHRQGRKPQPLKRQKANEQTATTQRAKAHTAKPPRFHSRHTHPPHAPALTAYKSILITHTPKTSKR